MTGFIQLTARERDTVLAALRLYQSAPHPLPDGIAEIATESGSGLSGDEIDTLCEEVNTMPDPYADGCPKCHGDIEGGSVHIEEGTATQDCYCLECEHEWTDQYGLFDRIELYGKRA